MEQHGNKPRAIFLRSIFKCIPSALKKCCSKCLWFPRMLFHMLGKKLQIKGSKKLYPPVSSIVKGCNSPPQFLVMNHLFFTLSLIFVGIGCILAAIGSGFIFVVGVVGIGTFVLWRL